MDKVEVEEEAVVVAGGVEDEAAAGDEAADDHRPKFSRQSPSTHGNKTTLLILTLLDILMV